MYSGAERVGDDDRESAVAALRHHFGRGLLSVDELEQRIADAYAARERGDIEAALVGLPAVPPDAQAPRPRPRWSVVAHRVHAQAYAVGIGSATAVWALTDRGDEFWPVYPAVGWGFLLALHTIVVRARYRG